MLCAAGLLTLVPATAAARAGRPDPGPPGDAAAPRSSPLYRSGTQVRPHPAAPRVPEVSALSWVVADAGTGDVLAANDAHRELPRPAPSRRCSRSRCCPRCRAASGTRWAPRALSGIGPGSSLVGVVEGQTYRVSDLWNGVFLNSGNDAVHVLASLTGGWSATAARMQAEARALGARDTHVRSPDGYDAPGQVSSAYDLAVFGREGLRRPDFARYCAKVDAMFPGRDGSSYGIMNTNRLLTGADGVQPYPGLIGVKNGYTSNAGNTLIAAARRDGRTLVVTVMNPQEGGGHAVYEEARALLDWGFEAAGEVDPVGSLDPEDHRPRQGPQAVPAAVSAAKPAEDVPGWPETGAILGVAGLGAGVMALALRIKLVRDDGS